MSPVGAIFVPFPPKTGTNMLHPRPRPQSLNWSGSKGSRYYYYYIKLQFVVEDMVLPREIKWTKRQIKPFTNGHNSIGARSSLPTLSFLSLRRRGGEPDSDVHALTKELAI